MPIGRLTTNLPLIAMALLALVAACGESTPTEDVDATVAAGVQATVSANTLTQSTSSPITTMTHTPEPDLQATVQVMVQAALPTETPTSTPDLEATIAAAVQSTAEAQPIQADTHTPTPTLAPIPTSTPIPAVTPVPTFTPQPTHTPLPAATPTLAQMIENVEISLAYIETPDGSGTGFIVDEDGLVVTNAHVVERFSRVTVVLADGREYEGNVLGIDEIADLAIVELNSIRKFEAMKLGNSDDVRVGDDVIALGFPLSYELGSSLTVTRGIISSKRVYVGIEELQTDAAINPGNSGGPLVNRDGEVVGVNYAELSLSDGSPVDNIGFSIAINELKDRMDSLKRGENAFLPTPTPGQWTAYKNEDYGYGLDIAPGWYLDEETDEGYAAFWNEDETGLMEIYTYELGSEWTLEEHAQSERDYLEKQAREGAWTVFEITAFQRRQDGQYDYYIFAYRWQSSDEYCVSNDISLIFLSDFHPSKPYGFTARGGVCEGKLDFYGEERDAMLSSFVEQDTHPASPTPGPWTTYLNDDYGYSIDIAPGWYLDEETDEGDAAFRSEDGSGLFDIFTYELGSGWTLEEFAQSEMDYLEEQAGEEAWNVFEITAFQRRQDSEREYYHLAYRFQGSAEYCVSKIVARVLMSDFYPSKPYGFVVESNICEDSLDLYSERRDAMLASFDP